MAEKKKNVNKARKVAKYFGGLSGKASKSLLSRKDRIDSALKRMTEAQTTNSNNR